MSTENPILMTDTEMSQSVLDEEDCVNEGDNDDAEDYAENDVGDEDDGGDDEDDENDDGESEPNDKYDDVDKNVLSLEQMLQSEILLTDGSAAKIFSRGPKYSEDLWPISCHICLLGNINEEEMPVHIQSKRHKRMFKRSPPDPTHYIRAFRQPFGDNPACVTPLRIFPGEFITEITPDLQHRIIKRDDWNYKEIPEDKSLRDSVAEHSKKASMMGLGYAFKMKKDGRLMYFCVLCRTPVHGEGYQHFSGSRHVDKYIVKHFPKSSKKVLMVLKMVEPTFKSIMVSKQQKYIRWICERIYTEIEKRKGALNHVKCVDSYDFTTKRSRYAEKARDSEHYDDDTIHITDAELEKYAKRALETMPLPVRKITKKLQRKLKSAEKKQQFKQLTQPRTRKNKAARLRRLNRSEQEANLGIVASDEDTNNLGETVGQEEAGTLLKKEEIKIEAKQFPAGQDKSVEKTKKVAASRTDKARRESKLFADSPLVWDRYSRMIGAILDDMEKKYECYENEPESHPGYELEWKKFWHMRADALEEDNIDPHTYDFNAEWMPFWIQRLQELHAKDIVKYKFDTKRKLNLSYSARSPSPVRRQLDPHKSRLPPTRWKQTESSMPPRKHQKYSHDEPLTIVSVMRLVSALEDQLGSLGPRAVELLSRAILSEKNNPNSNDLLMENDFYIFFMTAREKFNGQILARIVEPKKINAVNQTIDQITSLVDMMDEYRTRNCGGGRNIQHSNDGNQYNVNNQFNNNAGPSNQYPNQYSGGNQGGIWQSGAYRTNKGAYCGPNGGANNQSTPLTQNYRGGSNDNYQSGAGDGHSSRRGQMNIGSAGGNRQFSGGPTGMARMDCDNGNAQIRGGGGISNTNSGMINFRRDGPNNSGPNRSNQMDNSGERFNRGFNFSGPNGGGGPNSGNQMGNSGGRGGGSSQLHIGYNQPNIFNNLGGQSSDMGFGIARNSFLARGNNPNARAGGSMAMGQSSMGNYGGDGGYNSRSNKMNSQYTPNSGRFLN